MTSSNLFMTAWARRPKAAVIDRWKGLLAELDADDSDL